MKTVAVVTGARADYGILWPVMKAIELHPDLRLRLMATGAHLVPGFGGSVEGIERDGFTVTDRIDTLGTGDGPQDIAEAMGRGTIGFARAFGASRPDLLLVAGDRFEIHAAVVATLPFNIPVAHIHGGEITEGAVDDVMRHSITKMSHLHFVATELYGARVRQMGEEAWRVVVSGAPSLDTMRQVRRLNRAELVDHLGVSLDRPVVVATFHPVTREYGDTACQIGELLKALDSAASGCTVVFTYPNADTSNQVIVDAIRNYAETRPHARAVVNLGAAAYFGLLDIAAAVAGNSSSGIIEAASFRLPVVNVGNRQQGRLFPANVIEVGGAAAAIAEALKRALSPVFRAGLADLANPYGDGYAAERIVSAIASLDLDHRLLTKRFVQT